MKPRNEYSNVIKISLPEIVRAKMHEHGIDLVSEIRRAGLDVKRASLPTEYLLKDRGLKSCETIIACSVSSVLVATAISRVIGALSELNEPKFREKRLRSLRSIPTHSSKNKSKEKISMKFLGLEFYYETQRTNDS